MCRTGRQDPSRLFGDAALPPVERNAATLARYIVKEGLQRINAREIQRRKLPRLSTKEIVAEAIEHLIEADWLRSARQKPSDAGGRPRGDFLVNPAVHGDPNE